MAIRNPHTARTVGGVTELDWSSMANSNISNVAAANKGCIKCGRPINARGLCGLHYRHAQNQGLFGTPCSFENCSKPRVGKSLCSTHYAQVRRNENRELANARQRNYMKTYEPKEKGREKRRLSYETYRKRNLVKFADKERIRRGRKRANGGSYTRKDWLKLLNRFHHMCAYCNIRKATTADHVIPIARGGSNFIGNILPACFSCNASKQEKFLTEWRRQWHSTKNK